VAVKGKSGRDGEEGKERKTDSEIKRREKKSHG